MQRIFRAKFLFLLLSLIPTLGMAEPSYEPMDAIYARIHNLIKQNLDQNTQIKKIQIQKLGDHTHLPKCRTPIEIRPAQQNSQRFSTRPTFLVKCDKPAWKIFIRTRIEALRPVIMALKPIPRHTLIKQDQVAKHWLDISQIRPNMLFRLDQVIGYRAKRTISPKTAITAQMLLPPYWVQKKKPVTLLTRIDGIEVRTKGIALKNAIENEIVAVKNLRSGKTIRGIVIAPNTVLVP